MRPPTTAIRYQPDAEKNPQLHDWTPTFRARDNASFLAQVRKELELMRAPGEFTIDPAGVACIGLIGEFGLAASETRRVQSVVRTDRRPSYWSHAFLFAAGIAKEDSANRSRRASPCVWESTPNPAPEFRLSCEHMGISPRRLADYARSRFSWEAERCVPNIAVIAIGLTVKERNTVLRNGADGNADQIRYNLPDLIATWTSYLFAAAFQPNPLAAGHAHPAAAYLQMAFDGAGIDLAPGAHQRNLCPEHIWQAARYLYGAWQAPHGGDREERPVVGWYCVRDRSALSVPEDEEIPRDLPSVMRLHDLTPPEIGR